QGGVDIQHAADVISRDRDQAQEPSEYDEIGRSPPDFREDIGAEGLDRPSTSLHNRDGNSSGLCPRNRPDARPTGDDGHAPRPQSTFPDTVEQVLERCPTPGYTDGEADWGIADRRITRRHEGTPSEPCSKRSFQRFGSDDRCFADLPLADVDRRAAA